MREWQGKGSVLVWIDGQGYVEMRAKLSLCWAYDDDDVDDETAAKVTTKEIVEVLSDDYDAICFNFDQFKEMNSDKKEW